MMMDGFAGFRCSCMMMDDDDVDVLGSACLVVLSCKPCLWMPVVLGNVGLSFCDSVPRRMTVARHKLVSVGACPLGPHIAVTSGVKLCVSNLAILRSRFCGVTHLCFPPTAHKCYLTRGLH